MIFLELKKAIDLEKYNEYSEFVTTKLNEIFKELIATGQNQIILNTNLKSILNFLELDILISLFNKYKFKIL